MILLNQDLEFVNLPRVEMAKSWVVSYAGLSHSEVVSMPSFSQKSISKFNTSSVLECCVVVLVTILHIICASVAV
jgi:CBS domain containing-hemolysin-like protein